MIWLNLWRAFKLTMESTTSDGIVITVESSDDSSPPGFNKGQVCGVGQWTKIKGDWYRWESSCSVYIEAIETADMFTVNEWLEIWGDSLWNWSEHIRTQQVLKLTAIALIEMNND